MKSKSVVVIGAGVGGIVAATHLAQRGLNVTVVEKNSHPGGRCDRISRDGHHFDTGPTLLVMPLLYEAEFRALAARWYELSDFLVNVLKLASVPGNFTGTVTYHDSCSGLRELGIKQQPRALLAKAGCTLTEMQDAEKCCGFGGTFSIKLGEISTRMAENKCVNIGVAGADALVGGDLGCLLNIEGRLRRNGDMKTKVYHFAEIAAGMTGDKT